MKETLTPKRVLFICLGNACRSPMAEAVARRSMADVIEASSAGLMPLGIIVSMTRHTLEQNGLSADGLFSKPVTPELWEAAELVINMSGRSRETAFPEWEKVDDWDVEDPYGADPAVYQRIFEEIEQRVGELAERLRREVRTRKEGGAG
jgi:protein-tyrosine-phosphatase